MKNKTVKLILGAAFLVALIGAYAGIKSYVAAQEEKEAQEKDTSASVADMEADDITSIRFYSLGGNEIIFEKDSDSWIKKDEKDFPVSQEALNSAVKDLAVLDAEQEIKDPEKLEEYDLDEPQNEITLTEKDGNKTVLQIGMKNESTNQYYIKKSDDNNRVYLVASDKLDSFMGTEYEFAQAEAFPAVTSAAITEVEVDKEERYSLSQNEENLYWYVSDGKTSEQADTAKAGEVTSAVGALTYENFVDYNCTDQAEYGFDTPYAVITATYTEETATEANTDAEEASEKQDSTESSEKTEESASEEDKTEKQLVIYVGDETEGSRYVKVNDSNQVYTVAEASLTEILDKKASDFYSLTVSYLSLNNLENLEIQSLEGSHQVEIERTSDENKSEGSEKTEENNKSSQEEASKAEEEDLTDTEEKTVYKLDGKETDETAFTTFYNKLINMAGQERLMEEYKPEKDPVYTFMFTGTNGEKITVSYYEYDSSFYAAVKEDKVYLVNKMNVRDLEEAYEEMLGAE